MRKGKGKGKGKGKPSKGGKGKGKGASNCPAVAVIIEEARQKYACKCSSLNFSFLMVYSTGDICYTTEMGWMDADMVADITRIEEDIMSLPNEISDALTSDDWMGCIAKIEEAAMGYKK